MDPRAQEIIENFSFLEDWEDRYRYLIDLGKELEPMKESDKTEENRVHGCVSRVWVTSKLVGDSPRTLLFHVDSDAHIVRGLLAVLMKLVSNRPPSEIVALDIREVLEKLQLAQHLSPSRSNGLFSMVQRIEDISRSHLQK